MPSVTLENWVASDNTKVGYYGQHISASITLAGYVTPNPTYVDLYLQTSGSDGWNDEFQFYHSATNSTNGGVWGNTTYEISSATAQGNTGFLVDSWDDWAELPNSSSCRIKVDVISMGI